MTSAMATGAGRRTKIPGLVKLAYGSGNMVYGVSNAAITTFLFFYYTAVMGVSGSLVGAAAAISLIADAFLDPLLGSWSDNLRSRWGRRIPFMIVGAPCVALALGLLFSPPTGASEGVLFAWLVGASIFLRFSTSAFAVPFNALGAEISDDYAERSSVVAYRWVFEVLGALLTVVLGYSVFLAGPKGMFGTGYHDLAWTAGAIVIGGGVVCILGTQRFAGGLPVTAADGAGLHRRLPREVAEVFRNPSFRILFAAMVVFFVAQGVAGSLGVHLNTFVWKMTPFQIQKTSFGLFLGLLIGVPVAPFIVKKFEKRTIFILGLLALAVAQSGLNGLRVLGIFTLKGEAVVMPLFINALFAGIGVTLASIAIGSMMADAADEHDYLFRGRREGLYFAGVGFAAKTAYGLGTLVAGIVLDLIGFPKALVAKGVLVDIAPGTLNGLATVAGPVAGVFSVIGILLMLFYRIDRKRHAVVVAALQARRLAAEPA